jgi:alpha-L-rhamnosidase
MKFLTTSFLAIVSILAFKTEILGRSKTSKQKPNIVFILTDDQKADALGFLGNKYVSTPNIDLLAKKGVYFKNAFATTPICAASRASILTGTYERTHRYTFQSGQLDAELLKNAYPRLLKNAGYTTAHFGKLGVNVKSKNDLYDVVEDYDRNNAFNDRRGYFYKMIGKDTVHLSRYTSHKAVEFIKNTKKDKPFYLSVHFSAPHAHDGAQDQYFTANEYENLLEKFIVPPPILSEDKYFLDQPKGVREGFSRLRWGWRFDTPQKYQKMVKAYYNMITELDAEMGKVMAELKKQGQDKNTVIIFMADNGYLLGERQLADKWLMYDASVRVPLVIYDPRSKNGNRTIEQMVTNVDVSSTILQYAALSSPSQYQGTSLTKLVESKNLTSINDTLLLEHLWEFDKIPPSEGIRTNKWKYFRYVNDKQWEELYDLESDPIEENNLAKKPAYSQVLTDLRKACDIKIIQKMSNIGRPATDLTIEYIREPRFTEIYDLSPEFSWQIPASSRYQLAYQIMVASNQSSIDANVGDMWDSGLIKGNSSCDISYKGKQLEEGKKYFWKVRYWDYNNRHSEYSKSQEFTIGRSKDYITSPNSFLKTYHQPVSIKKVNGGKKLYDFGKHAFGTLHFEYNSLNEDSLEVELGEKVITEGNIDPNPGGTIRYAKVKIPIRKGVHDHTLALPTDKRNTLPIAVPMPDTFPVIMPYRYAQISDPKNIVADNKIMQSRFSVYWDEEKSSFHSNDNILNQVWDLCKYSIKATSFSGLYVDGDRERIPYEADAYLNQLSHYTTDVEYAIGRQTIEWFMKHPTWPTEWQQHVALMVYADYQYTGNLELVKAFYNELKYKTLMDLVGDHGLITSTKVDSVFMKKLGFQDPAIKLKDITDWPPAQKDTQWKLATKEGERDGFIFKDYNTIINSLYYANLMVMAEFAQALGKVNDQLAYREAATKAKNAINNHMFDTKTGAYVDGIGTDHSSLHSNIFALAFDLVPAERQKSVVEFIKSRGMACSVYGAQYLLDGLYNAGEAQYALDLMRSQSDRSWYNMIRAGSTVTLEAWDFKYKPNLDWNHAWGAVPANVIPRRMWGVRPVVPGCEIMEMKPQLADLTQTKITVPTLRGQIEASYKKVNDRSATYTIKVPGNMNINFYVPIGKDTEILHNGEKVSPLAPYLLLEPGEHKIDLVINSY